MSGKYEKEERIDNLVKKMLVPMPSILSDYYYSLIDSGKSYVTAKAYIWNVIQFIRFTFGDSCSEDFYHDVNENHISRYIASLQTKTVNGKIKNTSASHKTQNWSALNSFFQFLVPTYISTNPVAKTTRPEMKDNPDVTYLTTGEITRILNNIEKTANPKFKNRDLCIMKLGFTTGLRLSSIIQIDIDDLDLEHSQIHVVEKGYQDYHVMIGDNLKAQILLWLEDRKKHFSHVTTNALFVSQESNRVSSRTIKDLVDKYAEGMTDKHVTPHVMRNSFAMNLYEATGDIALCAKLLNNSELSNMMKYVKNTREKEKKALNYMDNLI